MPIDVATFGADLAAKLMGIKTGKFQGMELSYFHRTENAHTPGQSYQGATFVQHPTPINGILDAPGGNEDRAADPATLHTRRVLVRREELPPVVSVGDRWQEPSGETYEVTALPVADPADATRYLIGERSTAP
jgi:hypothetical protein